VITIITCEFMQDGRKIRTSKIIMFKDETFCYVIVCIRIKKWLYIIKCRMWNICYCLIIFNYIRTHGSYFNSKRLFSQL
jgi:hypothetical protein